MRALAPSNGMTLTMTLVIALGATLALMLAGCKDGAAGGKRAGAADADAAAKPVAAAAGAAATGGAGELGGTQDQLAEELDAAAQEVDGGGNAAVRQRWQGKRVRWTVTRVAVLCSSAEACYVQPFAAARRTETSAHGWMPQLELSAGEYEKLAAGCGEAAACPVLIEGTLDRLNVSDELPTSVHLAEVHVVKAG